jgi:alanine racemase
VPDPILAIQYAAILHRKHYDRMVIAITGSNGKTIVKEWMAQLMGPDRFFCKSPKSFNSQLGVPLSVWNLRASHQLGLFEAGISQPGEMERLEAVLMPESGILTNIGTAHQEAFPSEIEKLKEKLKLFKHAKSLILSYTLYERYKLLLHETLPYVYFHTWYWEYEDKEKNEVWLISRIFRPDFQLMSPETRDFFILPFRDSTSMENLGNAIRGVLFLKVLPSSIQSRLNKIGLPQMRMSRKEGVHDITLIDDSYTNDLSGLEAALQFARLQRKSGQNLILVLSDLEEASESIERAREFLPDLLSSFEISQLVLVGQQFQNFPFAKNLQIRSFISVSDLLLTLSPVDFEGSLILIKGARKFGMERLALAWQKKLHGTRLEINLDAMVHNLNFYKSQIPKGTGIMAMVKALGYGAGDEEIARVLEYHRVQYLAVAYADEGVKLRAAGIILPILVMNPTPDAFPLMIKNRLEPEIFSFSIWEEYLKTVKASTSLHIPAIHIKVDTGMHRLGFLPEEGPELAQKLLDNPDIRLATVFSHLAGADEEDLESYSRQQIDSFESFCSVLTEISGRSFAKHILNSAGILRFPEATYNYVRLGIGLYGIEVNSWHQQELLPVSCLKTTISQIKDLKKGDSVGYGRSTILERDSRVATIAIGYSDGFRRAFSKGKAKVAVHNHLAPVLGNVCMDMTMIDVTDTNAREGDEVRIFEDAASLLRLAKAGDTIPYEILTGIGHRVKRVFYRE